jgi:hypothetical protein
MRWRQKPRAVYALNAIGLRFYKSHVGPITLASPDAILGLLKEADRFSLHFLLTEWEQVVDAWQLDSWEAYRDVARLGRKTRLPEARRKILWSMFEHVSAGLKSQNLMTHAQMFSSVATAIGNGWARACASAPIRCGRRRSS